MGSKTPHDRRGREHLRSCYPYQPRDLQDLERKTDQKPMWKKTVKVISTQTDTYTFQSIHIENWQTICRAICDMRYSYTTIQRRSLRIMSHAYGLKLPEEHTSEHQETSSRAFAYTRKYCGLPFENRKLLKSAVHVNQSFAKNPQLPILYHAVNGRNTKGTKFISLTSADE